MNSIQDTIQRQSVIGFTYAQILAVLFAFGGLMSLGWLDNARGPIYPLIIQDLNLTHSQGSTFFALASFMAVLANFLVPALLSVMHSKRLLFFGVCALGLFPILLSMTQTFSMLLFSAAVFGWSLGTVGVVQNIVVEENVPAERKRFFLSLLHSTYGLAALLAPLLVGLILSSGVNWRYSFLYALFFMVPVLILGLISLRSHSRISAEFQIKAKNRFKIEYDKKLLLFWGLLLACYVSSELYFTTRLVVISKELFGLNIEDANLVLALFFLGLFIGRILIGVSPQGFSGRLMLLTSFIITSAWILFCFFFAPQLTWLVGLFMAPVFPLAMDEISNQTGKEFSHYSSMIIASSSVGVVLMHLLVGYIFDNYGMMSAGLLPFLLCLICGLMCFLFWPNPQK